MPKGPGAPVRPRKQPLTDHLVEASVAAGMNDDTGHYGELVYGPVTSHERALEIKRSLFRCAKYMGYSMKADIESHAEGYQIRFAAIDKAKARAHIAARYKGREHEMPYNPFQKTGPRT